MESTSKDSGKVLYGNFACKTTQTAMSHEAIEAMPQADLKSRQSVLEHIKSTFKSLVRRPIEAAWIESKEGAGAYDYSKPAYGPYGGYIGYFEDGTPNHFLKHYINTLREKRPFTVNAIELRCDALCLAIYISGITQIDTKSGERKALEGVRVVVYDYNNLKHTSMSTVKTAEDLLDKLHHILTTTYNRLAREYNLAGFTSEFLTLVSSHRAIPDIRIDMEN
ncbi:hypothetical protein [Stutzerimonas stutzeri]|uniref:hypothetical protein n=1 Tax=Stutzerimonas stutzeri TaxID=316 RepID=UPI00265CBC13|nr:hypothetical protein [Stutzerimonas stutzeri]MCF6783743.1 hypothetical protein [Stutzerimonas stutzeri]